MTTRAGAAAVYFPACINRIFGNPESLPDRPSLPEVVVTLADRAGAPVWIPEDVAGLCCGTVWHSKGYERGNRYMANAVVEHLWRWTDGGQLPVVVVDYLQKVPVIPEPPNESEKVTYVINGLKDIALSEDVPMIAIVAADKEGLKASRLRNYHLRGSSAINYEADVILILNEKYQIVAKVNIEFNPYQAQRFRDWVVLSVEKNRGGQDNVDLEYEKHFEFSCFDPNGRTVQEKLIEERLYNE